MLETPDYRKINTQSKYLDTSHVKLPDNYNDYNRILSEREIKKKINNLEDKINSLEIKLKELEDKCQD